MRRKSFFLKSAIVVTLATVLSKVLGLIRQQYGLYFFGGGWEYDSFVAAFRIPNALRELLAEGAFSSAFIPLFSALLVKKGKEEAFAFANKILTLSIILSLLSVVIGLISSPMFMKYYHYNPSAPDSSKLAIELFNILMLYLPLISLSAVLMGMLNSLDVFFIPSLGPFISNLLFIIVLFTVYKFYGIHTLTYALIVGGLAYFLMQIPFIYKKGFRFRLSFSFKGEYIEEFVRLFIPFALALGIPKLNNILSNIYSDAITGANTALAQSFFMIQLPISIFVVSVSTVSLPSMSRYYENNEMKELKRLILVGLRMAFIFTLPAFIGFIMLNYEISSFIYSDIVQLISGGSRGAINDSIIRNIANTVSFFAPCVISIGFAVIFIRAFQSIRNMWYLIYSSILSVILHLSLMYIFIGVYKLPFYTIALSISISSFFNLILLFIFLRKKLSGFNINGSTMNSIVKIIFAALSMTIILYFLKKIMPFELFSLKYLNNIVSTLFIIMSGILVYFVSLYILKEEGFLFFVQSIRRRLFTRG